MLTAIPATAETRLSFAALADLLGPVLADVLPHLPPPRRRALEVALLLDDGEGPPPDHRAVAFAFLGAVKALAREGPVVVAVDDIQWLDSPSAFMVEFALRRLRDEPVVFLLTLRTGEEPMPLGLLRALPEDGLRRLTIGPLSPGALHRLLRDRLGPATDGGIHAEPGGLSRPARSAPPRPPAPPCRRLGASRRRSRGAARRCAR